MLKTTLSSSCTEARKKFDEGTADTISIDRGEEFCGTIRRIENLLTNANLTKFKKSNLTKKSIFAKDKSFKTDSNPISFGAKISYPD